MITNMRLPTRRSEKQKIMKDDGPFYITKEGLEKLKQKLHTIETHNLPKAIEDVRATAEFGDFSENAEYQEAKWRMRRLRNQALSITEKIRRAILIETQTEPDVVRLGSRIILEKNGVEKTYRIVGPHEADPARGRISYLSPLGASLIGRKEGEEISGYHLKQIQL